VNLLRVFSAALCFIGVAMCVDTALNESGKLNFDFIHVSRFEHRRIYLCLKLMRNIF